MKKLFYSFIAVFALLFTGCADKDVVEAISNGDNQPGVTVSMSMEGDMGQTAATRAIGYETDDNTGFPTPVGIFDKGTSEGKEIADGSKVEVLLIFKSSDGTQPVTKVVTNWIYKKGGNLTLLPSEKFEMAAGTDLSKGTWFVCGILGGEMLPGNNQVKFNGFSEGHTARNSAGEKLQWGANIPYVFSWRQLTTNAANKTIKAEKAVKFKQFGSIVRLKVTNKTGFDFMYNGVRIITSNILCGQFDLKSFDDVATSDLKDTEDGDIASAKDASYKNAFKAFKFYQRPLTDAAMTGNDGLINKKGFRLHGTYVKDYADEKAGALNTALTYYDHIFLKKQSGNNFDNVPNGQPAPSYIYVWMAPQQQAVKIYDGDEEGKSGDTYTTKKFSKTQFLLMAVPTETSVGNKIVPTSINMLPAYGTLADYVSGANYPAKGNVVYNFPPLSYVAKHDNFGTEAELSTDANQDIAHTQRYAYSEIESSLNNPSKVPNGYMFASDVYWRSIIPQAYGFSGLREKNHGTPFYNYSMGIVSPAMLPVQGWTSPKLVYQCSSKGVQVNGKIVAYMIGLSKKPDYITDDTEGRVYQGYAKQSFARASSGIKTSLNWITTNDYRYVMRWEDDNNNNAILTQRYLGPRFVLDMDDIANEDFWAAPKNYDTTYPADVKRIVPLTGVYIYDTGKFDTNPTPFFFWYKTAPGHSAQYWTPTPASTTGRYAMGDPNITTHTESYNTDGAGAPPMQAVGFRMPVKSADLGSFFYYLFKGVPKNHHREASKVHDDMGHLKTNYEQGLIMKAPVRLWKTTPYAD
ncbi:hypothetical protein [Prevotella sp.]|uniref:hypothetical protein n=1 Tax=Prevotella sp. TaxID=59823 RepID=UPI001CABF0CA|nr:hypothetical protein [Prevotella sp.]MBF1581004.1 hypothetical protein [Prevotella sp.]